MVDPLTPLEAKWLERAREQLESFEQTMNDALASLDTPPVGDRAARKRELKRRARIERLPQYLRSGLHQATLARAALAAHPRAGQAVYHALMVGMFWLYPHAADVHASSRTKREAAKETNLRRAMKKNPPLQQNRPAR